VEAHTGSEVAAAARQELHLVDVSAEESGLDLPVRMARDPGQCAEVGSDCDLARVAEGHVPVHYRVERAEVPLGTDHEPDTSN